MFNVNDECADTIDALKSELLKMSSCLQKLLFVFLPRCATSAVICYWDDYLDVVGPTQDTIRYPLNFVL